MALEVLLTAEAGLAKERAERLLIAMVMVFLLFSFPRRPCEC